MSALVVVWGVRFSRQRDRELAFECPRMHEQHLGWAGGYCAAIFQVFLAGKDLQGVVWGLCCF
jgi:hypothetical protein